MPHSRSNAITTTDWNKIVDDHDTKESQKQFFEEVNKMDPTDPNYSEEFDGLWTGDYEQLEERIHEQQSKQLLILAKQRDSIDEAAARGEEEERMQRLVAEAQVMVDLTITTSPATALLPVLEADRGRAEGVVGVGMALTGGPSVVAAAAAEEEDEDEEAAVFVFAGVARATAGEYGAARPLRRVERGVRGLCAVFAAHGLRR
ncbi:hypothetical protein LTR08_007583 [Meristemomyces frigidus]|nr:hypothetical protein LTR08_007583 [Meristemomyces frigidus]